MNKGTFEKKVFKYIRYNIPGIAVAVIFTVLMAWYNFLMVESYNYTVFDLGLNYRLMSLLIFNHLVLLKPPLNILYPPHPLGKMAFVPLSVGLLIYNSVFTILLEQILVISAGGYALFRITNIKTGNTFASIILEVSYFLYPATYGFMAHGGNIQIFFPGFLLIGYLFFTEKRIIPSLLAFFLASITNFVAPFIVMAFLLFDWVANIEMKKVKPFRPVGSFFRSLFWMVCKQREGTFFYLFMFAFEILFGFFDFIYVGGTSGILNNSRLTGFNSTSLTGNLLEDMGTYKIPFFYQVFSPVMFLSLLTPYSVIVIVYFVLTFASNTGVYYMITQQFSSLFYSFVFIGTVHFFRNRFTGVDIKKMANSILVLVLVSSIFSFAIYSPFSVSNFQNGTIQEMGYVSQFDNELTAGLSLIPDNASVFIQNDIPQLMNREMVYMPGYYDNQTVDFAVIIPFGFSPLSKIYGGYDPYWGNMFQHNSSYGVYEYIQGAVIYKLYYSGHPVIYIPSSSNYSTRD